MYPVDWDYFAKIISTVDDKERLNWFFGCHGIHDLKRIDDFVKHFGIRHDCVFIFRTDKISVRLKNIGSEAGKNEPKSLKQKQIAVSDDNKWKVTTQGLKLMIADNSTGKPPFVRVFSSAINGAVFDKSGKLLFLVIRGIYEGVFLLRYEDGAWRYIAELEGIPHQGVVTKRLRRILVDDTSVIFVYNSRVRKYALKDGSLITNLAVQRAPERRYDGEDLTERFGRIYNRFPQLQRR